MKWLRRLLRREEKPGITVTDLEFVQSMAYQRGLAEGELRGRLALAKELEIAYGVDSGHEMTPEDVRNIKARQVH